MKAWILLPVLLLDGATRRAAGFCVPPMVPSRRSEWAVTGARLLGTDS